LQSRLREKVPPLGSDPFPQGLQRLRPSRAAHLERPKGRRPSDDFYSHVAKAYVGAVVQGMKPRVALADAAGVSTDVVGRWVREARRRGKLSPTTPGRVRA
jgi:hypothetical protein